MSGSGVRLIFRSMSGSVQLKNLRFKSLTNWTQSTVMNKTFAVPDSCCIFSDIKPLVSLTNLIFSNTEVESLKVNS